MQPMLPVAGIEIQLVWPQLKCFSCDLFFDPFTLWRPGDFNNQVLPPLTIVADTDRSQPSRQVFRVVDATDERILELADAAGWRKLTLYRRTFYVCPGCRKLRTRAQWEQRLVEPLHGARVLEEPKEPGIEPIG